MVTSSLIRGPIYGDMVPYWRPKVTWSPNCKKQIIPDSSYLFAWPLLPVQLLLRNI